MKRGLPTPRTLAKSPMSLPELIAALSEPAAYPAPAPVRAVQTHISAVFLVGDVVYKVKKSVDLGFLDFSTLAKREHFCGEEVRLNRRLAPEVYLGVVPVVRTGAGLRVEAEGEPVEWAVKMVRLPEGVTLLDRLGHDSLTPAVLETLAGRLAAFHAAAERGPHIAEVGGFDTVAFNARENFRQSAGQIGRTVERPVFERLSDLTESALFALRPLMESRAARGVPCDTHGDLRLDHVYLFPDRPPPGDVVIIDCIEFNERFRFADPVADVAFLAMDLGVHGRGDLAGVLTDAWFRAAGDEEGRALLAFYSGYRAVVRAKVEGFAAGEPEVPTPARAAAAERSRRHWLWALGAMEPDPVRRPALVLAAGLPGTGKSTLAAALAERAGFALVRSDLVRKELPDRPAGEALYSAEWSDRTYAECLRRAAEVVRGGGRVIVDANFREERRRAEFLSAARDLGVSSAVLVCTAEAETIRRRLDGRRGDASDADWAVYRKLAGLWEPPGPATRRVMHEIRTDLADVAADDAAIAALRAAGLA